MASMRPILIASDVHQIQENLEKHHLESLKYTLLYDDNIRKSEEKSKVKYIIPSFEILYCTCAGVPEVKLRSPVNAVQEHCRIYLGKRKTFFI